MGEDKSMTLAPDETPEFWLELPMMQVARAAADLQKFHRNQPAEMDKARMVATRLAMSSWLKGTGIEVGAGNRPFHVRDGLNVIYGDIRDDEALSNYFGNTMPILGGSNFIDAQTFEGVPDESVDFVISAHVIEHLFDPIGAIEQAMRVIRKSGIYLIAVPDKRFMFDHKRPVTDIDHLLRDHKDGGDSTRLYAFFEEAHFTFDHPVDVAWEMAEHNMKHGLDIHVHCWTHETFMEMLKECEKIIPMRVDAGVLSNNENIFALRKI